LLDRKRARRVVRAIREVGIHPDPTQAEEALDQHERMCPGRGAEEVAVRCFPERRVSKWVVSDRGLRTMWDAAASPVDARLGVSQLAGKAPRNELEMGATRRERALGIRKFGLASAVHSKIDAMVSARRCVNRRFLAAIGEGLADVNAGRVLTTQELKKSFEAEFGPIAWQ
jgi:hypothetical protein